MEFQGFLEGLENALCQSSLTRGGRGSVDMATRLLRDGCKKKVGKYGFTMGGGIVGKKWEPRNPVPGPFSAKIRKVNQNSESRREFGK